MNLNKYQNKAMATCKKYDSKDEMLLNAALGLCGETAEFLEEKIDKQHIEEELGDIMWYAAELCEYFNLNLDDVAKLKPKNSDSNSQKETLVISAGKIADITKRHFLKAKEIDIEKIKNYLANILTCITSLAIQNNTTLQKACEANITKLQKRHGSAYSGYGNRIDDKYLAD